MPEPVPGDGVIDLGDGDQQENEMADIAAGVAAQFAQSDMGDFLVTNNGLRGVNATALGVLQGAIVRRHDEVGPIESRGVASVLATPVGAPSPGGATGPAQ